MTQLELARAGKGSGIIRSIAKDEGLGMKEVLSGIVAGTIVVPHNSLRRIPRPCGIGEGLKTKVNANIGTSKDSHSVRLELRKMALAVSLGADAIMDLSTGPRVPDTRESLLGKCLVPFGTVPIYEIVIRGLKKYGKIRAITVDEMFDCLEEQARSGVDFFTIHAGITKRALNVLKGNPRVLDIVSRGGAFLAQWMLENNRENPFYEYFDRVCAIAKRYDVTLSLGDGLRPGAIEDATDAPQISELLTLGELQSVAHSKGVQVMIEGPGHVPMDEIRMNVLLEKSICHRAPFYVLGPLVTDVAPGYDHITSAIGGAIAAWAGADFLCYVTPAEHVRLPTLDDVREGVVAAKIAAHAADIAKGLKGASQRDLEISKARKARDWKRQFRLALDGERPMKYRQQSRPNSEDVCTMCSEYCSIKTAEMCFKR